MKTRLASALRSAVLSGFLVVAGGGSIIAENWPQWRGPHSDGSSADTHLGGGLGTQAWATPMPGSSAGTPVVWGDRVFLSSLDADKNLLAVCVGLSDGKVIWQKRVGIGPQVNKMNDMASPSPITDGKTVWFYYGTGDLASFDFSGNPLWARNLPHDHGQFNMLWIYSASPLLDGGKLYVPVLHRDEPVSGPPTGKQAESYLLAIDPQTGKDLWKVIRKTDAVKESREAYTTPIPVQVDGQTQIVISGGDYVTAQDATDGHELWRTPSWNPAVGTKGKISHWRTVASAAYGAGMVFACPPKGAPLFAVKPVTGSASGDSTEVPIAWQNSEATTDVTVPLFYNNQLYVLAGDKAPKAALICLDPATGQKKWSTPLATKKVFRASPTGADGKIYLLNEGGEVWVVSATDGKILAQHALGSEGGNSRSSIVIANGFIVIRTADHLYGYKPN